MLRWYNPTDTELLICDLYHAFGIHTPEQLDIDHVAAIWGIDVHYYPGRPFTQWDDDGAVILLTKGAVAEENRAAFFHELCHPVKHEGYQEELLHCSGIFRRSRQIIFNLFRPCQFPCCLIQSRCGTNTHKRLPIRSESL